MQAIPLDHIRPTTNPLRQVDERSVEFEELKDSIEACGILQPILVRPEVSSCSRYEVVDGMNRYTAAKQLGFDSIPCVIRELSDDEVLKIQVVTNCHHLETKPIEYARRLRAIMRRKPDLTQADMGRLLHKSAAWVRNTLGLLKLKPAIAKRVERGEMPLASAYLLSQLAPTLQETYVNEAVKKSTTEFAVFIRPILLNQKEHRHVADTFDPVPHLRSLKDITTEITQQNQAAVVLAAEGIDNILDAFIAGLKWATHTDILSIRKYEHEYRTRQSTR